MILAINVICLFSFYYFASFRSQIFSQKCLFIFLFLIASITIRLLVPIELNKDYYGYLELHNFDNPDNLSSFLFSEPYLYLIFKFFNIFTADKKVIVHSIYWFNFVLSNVFFVWLLARRDLSVWKKIVLFSFYYFLFGFVLLRNGPVYILFALFFYYSYRKMFFSHIILTPLMHLSALTLMPILFNRNKYYFKILILFSVILLPLFLVYFMPLIESYLALNNALSKIDSYSSGVSTIGIFHKLYFVFILCILSLTYVIYKTEAINPILITSSFIYFVSFYFNPVVGYRFSPYILMAILFLNSEKKLNIKLNNFLDLTSFSLVLYFFVTLFDSHYL
jgi:hypothetical protein